MKQEIAKIWVDALRSGRYEQARGLLRSADNKFCCLGVLCDLYATIQNPDEQWIFVPGPDAESEYRILDEGGALPELVINWLFLETEIQKLMDETSALTEILVKRHWLSEQQLNKLASNRILLSNILYLTTLNDSGFTFNEIADIIEQHWQEM